MRILDLHESEIVEEEIAADELLIVTDRDELVLVANSITEALHTIEERQFDTRLGALPEKARALRESIKEILRSTHRPQ